MRYLQSGGRVGGSSFRSSAPRSAPSVPRSSGPAVRNYNYYSAPPLVGGYGGYGYGYGGGGISLFPTVPIFFGGGGLFNIIIFMFVASTVAGVVRNLFNRRRNDSDEFDD
ncbi:hypothetical protein WJX75_001577 [Coccomyxa subellipsoidea]|uniref:Transmembrane protein n=1 Tax=Coccomyxa subellipsoidea TaxID=248742 RepID=A0ABR2YBM5_9CHLO